MTRPLVCLCGAGLIWVPYFRGTDDETVLAEPRSVLPFDRRPIYSPQHHWRIAEYALLFGNTQARRITPDALPDPAVERVHTIHYATCPQRVTAKDLTRRKRRPGRPSSTATTGAHTP